MTEDQIIARAREIVKAHYPEMKPNYAGRRLQIAIDALRLATQPEQDPALVKALAVFDDANAAYWNCTAGENKWREASALIILKHYPAPDAAVVAWAKWSSCQNHTFDPVGLSVADYILFMAGEKQ